jgi:uncharacterized membrane protein YfcA
MMLSVLVAGATQRITGIGFALVSAPLLVVLTGPITGVRLLRRTPVFSGPGGAIAAGALSGFMNVTAGVGGPAITLYAIGSRWPLRSFVGSMQFYFALVNTGSIIAKGLPHVGTTALAAAMGALVLGVLLGHVAARRIDPERARNAVLFLAMAGATGTLVKGLILRLQ